MDKRLCDLVEIATNNRSCVLLKVKDGTPPADLIKLGFDGNETLLRLMKNPTNPSVTIFHKEGPPVTMSYGSSTTVVSGPLKAMRDQIVEAVTLDFGIYVTGEGRHGKSYDELVSATLGERDLSSRRNHELQSGGHCYSLFVNEQHVASIDAGEYGRWMEERGIKPIAQARYGAKEIGYLMPRDEALERPFEETFSQAGQREHDERNFPFSREIEDAFARFQSKDGWRGLTAEEAVSEFVRFAKREPERTQGPAERQGTNKQRIADEKPPVQIGELDGGLVYPGHADRGPVFVDEAAFRAKEGVCYIPASGFEDITGDEDPGAYPLELCTFYTHQDFMELCHGSQKTAQALFDRLDGRSPETIFLEMRGRSLDDLIREAKGKSAERSDRTRPQPPNDRKHGPER